jgi:hypothetical protein
MIEIGDNVIVPEPNDTDNWRFSFSGTVIGLNKGYAQIEDQEGYVFDIEPERLNKE